jgi:CRP-like cAMP-binding protein
MAESRTNETPSSKKLSQSFQKSEAICEEGSTGSEMYLIHNGRVLLMVKQGESEQVPLTVLKAGDFFGEMALADDSPRSATATALEDHTELISIDRARFLFMVRQQPEFALSLMHTLCHRIRDLDKQLSPEGASS